MAICLEIMEAKNKDYSTDKRPFKNINSSLLVGVEPERAILVRLLDKVSRIDNLLDKENAVKDESIKDSIRDGINYLLLLSALIDDRG